MPSLQELIQWRESVDVLPHPILDFHRLTIEHFLWANLARAREGQARVLDVGVEYRKPYLAHLGANYVTVNEDDPLEADWHHPPSPDSPDVLGDIHALPFPDEDYDFVLCTETLEHVAAPWVAVEELRRVLRPGGVALVTAPFLWPWHGSSRYADFWRFTSDGMRHLFRSYRQVKVLPIDFQPEAPVGEVARVEHMHHPNGSLWATGYCVKAVK